MALDLLLSGSNTRVHIVPQQIDHVYALVANLRDADRLEMTGLDLDPRAVIRSSYRNGIMRRTAFVDGKIAAMWGLGGVMLSDEGAPWLMTTPMVERVPVSFLRIARAQVAEMLSRRKMLSNVVQASYAGACNLLEHLGFTLDEPEPLGPHAVPFRRFSMTRIDATLPQRVLS